MTLDRDLDRRLAVWFDERSVTTPPVDLLVRSLDRVNETRQTGSWRFPGAALRSPARFGRVFVPAWAVLLLLAFLAGVLVGVGSRLVGPRPAISEPSPTATSLDTPSPAPPRSASWTPTGSLSGPSALADAVRLPDGKVLMDGQLYDPQHGTWSSAGVNPEATVADRTVTVLSSGMVLVAGGAADHGNGLVEPNAELYDPQTNTWSATGSMSVARRGHAAALLPDGRVLVVGGTGARGNYDFLSSAEIYDPSSGSWSLTGSMADPRGQIGTCCSLRLRATQLQDGTVLVAGGPGLAKPGRVRVLAKAEVYDPSTGTWTSTGRMTMPRAGHTATLLADGRVLVVGGTSTDNGGASAEIYDPRSRTWTATPAAVLPVGEQTATLLADGRVLVAGGANALVAAAQLFDPRISTWTSTVPMLTGRANHAAILLLDGRVLVAGGFDANGTALASAELYDPGTGN